MLIDGECLESAACWRMVGRHDNRLLCGLRPRSLYSARPPASKQRGTSLPDAVRAVDSTRLSTRQYFLDGDAVAGHLDSLRRLDDIR